MVNPQNKKSVLEPRFYTGENGIIPEEYRKEPSPTQKCSGVAKYLTREVLSDYLTNNYNSTVSSVLSTP